MAVFASPVLAALARRLLHVQHADEIVVRRGKAVVLASLGLLLVCLVAAPLLWFSPVNHDMRVSTAINIVVALVVYSGVLLAARRGYVLAAAVIFNVVNALGPVTSTIANPTSQSPLYLTFVILLAAATLPSWTVLGLGAGSIVLVASVASQLANPVLAESYRAGILILLLTTVIGYILSLTTERSIQRLQVTLGELGVANTSLEVANDTLAQMNLQLQDALDEIAVVNATLEQRVESRTAELFAAHEQRRNTQRVVSHDMRNALMAMLLDVQVARTMLPSDTFQDVTGLLESFQATTELLGRVTSDLMDSALAETGELPLKPSWFNLRDLTATVLRQLSSTLYRNQIAITFETKEAFPICADQARIERVLHNIVGNAIKFTPPGGAITVTLHAGDGRVVWACRDTGRGVKPEELHLLGRQLTRLIDPNDPTPVQGTGLGLYTVTQILHASGGTIDYQSEGLGRGLEVMLTFPEASPIHPLVPPLERAHVA